LRLLQFVSEPWFRSGKNNNNKGFHKFLTCNRMIRTRKGTMIEEGFEERQGEDPLEDTTSHMPLEPQQSRLGESTRLIRDTDLRQTEGLQVEGSNQ